MTIAPISITQLQKSYRGKKGKRVEALRELSLTIDSGEVFGFLGPNGAGKSTTIKILMGLLRPTAGDVRLFGAPSELPDSRRRVGYLPENPSFYDFLSAREYLRFVGSSFKMKPDVIREQSDRVLKLLDLETAAGRPIRGFSKGMVQRLGIAQALLHDPDLLIFDEPMSGLDPIGRSLVKDIILDQKKQGKTVFFSTHVTADVERVCDRIGVIVGGVLQEQRVVSELMREGVDGYFCRVRGCSASLFGSLGISAGDDGIVEGFVPRDRFDSFSSELLGSGGSFDLVEPHRRDVEDYFLALVRNAEGVSCN